jgi:hypothetical protein
MRDEPELRLSSTRLCTLASAERQLFGSEKASGVSRWVRWNRTLRSGGRSQKSAADSTTVSSINRDVLATPLSRS